MDIAAIGSAAGALKTAVDITKELLSLRDTTAIQAKVREMQAEISSALASTITAQQDQLAMLKRVGDLEKEIADLKAWNGEKEKYELKPISQTGAVAYMLKSDTREAEPAHWLCTNCYQNRKKSILQYKGRIGPMHHFNCPSCSGEVVTNGDRPRWL